MSRLPFTTHRRLEAAPIPALGDCTKVSAKHRRIIPPVGGWEKDTLYLVHVAYSGGNPIHEAYCFIGFVDDAGSVGSYSEIWCNTYEDTEPFGKAAYLRVVEKLHTKTRRT